MTINKAIRFALSIFPYECYYNTYTGTDETYLVFNYTMVPDAYSDDEPEYNRYLCQVHFYAPFTFNSIAISQQIKQVLEDAGFTYPEQTDASDEEGQHIVFEFEGIEFIDRKMVRAYTMVAVSF